MLVFTRVSHLYIANGCSSLSHTTTSEINANLVYSLSTMVGLLDCGLKFKHSSGFIGRKFKPLRLYAEGVDTPKWNRSKAK
jgi:F0F1-type ATP synthase membrane subunit a